MSKKSKKPQPKQSTELQPEIKHPHDRLFRNSMEEVQIARDWLRANLPAELLSQMDLSTLIQVNGDVVLSKLQQRLQTDCVYRCQIKDTPGYIVTIIDHLSTPKKLMPFVALEYSTAIMRHHYKQPFDILLSLKGAGFLLRSGLRLTHFGGFLLHRAASLHPLSTG